MVKITLLIIMFLSSANVFSSNNKELGNYKKEIQEITSILINKYKIDTAYGE